MPTTLVPSQTVSKRGELTFSEDQLLAELCRKSYYRFVQEMWDVIVPETPVWNWHLKEMCDRIQILVERVFRNEPKLYDLVTNVPPGMSKSLVHSVFLPAWCWTRMPSFKFIGASYSYPLAQELSVKTRDVVLSDKYQKLFPVVSLREDQNTKGHFKTLQGGGRYAVGVNGAVTGFHAHCLPWDARVVTSEGEFPIGLVVDNRMSVDIMSFDHTGNRTRWQKIERYESQPGRPLHQIRFEDGGQLELTDDHQVFVVGRGYVDPVELRPGDLMYDCYEVEARQGGVQQVQGRVRVSRQALPESQDEKQDRQPVLLVEVSAREEENGQTGVPVRKGVFAGGGDLLLGGLSGQVQERDGQRAVDREGGGRLRILRDRDEGESRKAGQGQEQSPLLRPGMCERSSFGTDDRGGQLELRPREQPPAVLARLRQDQEEDQDERRAHLPSVQPDGRTGRQEDVYSPCGLHEEQQLETKPDVGLQGVSREFTPEESSCPRGLRHRVVRSVERSLRVPSQVYNLKVAQDENYFAEGVLVHNCIVVDDPLNPNEAASPADLAAANRWLRETLPSRKVDKTVAMMILVMQRLHQDDPTAQMVKRGGVYRLCLPATDEDPIRPTRLKEMYVDGLLDPVRLPRKVLEETEKEMGEVAYAAQYRERPVPAGGAMFKVAGKWTEDGEHKKTHIRKLSPDVSFTKFIRFWDKAGTQGGRGPFTAGTLLAERDNGTWWVLDVTRFRLDLWGREAAILEQARLDRSRWGDVMVGLEQEPGSGGKESLQATVQRLKGFRVWWWKVDGTTGGKELRAEPWATQVNAGNVVLLEAEWNDDFVNEHRFFPNSRWKDQVDSASGAFQGLAGGVVEVGGLQ